MGNGEGYPPPHPTRGSGERRNLPLRGPDENDFSTFKASQNQGRPVNVKHDARCVMGKVGGKTKDPKKGGGIFIYCYKSIT